jgi:hypothetical protein
MYAKNTASSPHRPLTTTSAIPTGEVPSLDHELRDDAVEGGAYRQDPGKAAVVHQCWSHSLMPVSKHSSTGVREQVC